MRTGDVAKITPGGWLMIVDRTKDLVKSGGEWISSIDVENAALGLQGRRQLRRDRRAAPQVARAAAAGGGQGAGRRTRPRRRFSKRSPPSVAKWQMPDDVVFVDALPMTATGKISKKDLRARFADYKLPD